MYDDSYYKKYEPIDGVWRIVRRIGQGNFGKVFEIEREEFGHVYKAALKAISVPADDNELRSVRADGMDEQSMMAYYRGFVENLTNELAIMDELKGTSNIVSYANHSIIPHEGSVGWDILIRMELLTPLLDHTEQNGMTEREAVKLGIDICKALELCNKKNLIHRDIKPENIFISEVGDYKLGDFGIAKTIEKTQGSLTGGVGTPPYMSPEVYMKKDYGPNTDVYSLGMVLYRILNANRLPFLPQAPAPITYLDRETALTQRMAGTPIPKPVNGDPELVSIVLRACAFDPEERYASAAEMRRELERVLPRITERPMLLPYAPAETKMKTDTMDFTIGGEKSVTVQPEDTDGTLGRPTYVVRYVADGKEITRQKYHFGDQLKLPDAPPDWSDEAFDYHFSNWSPDPEEYVLAEKTYTAVFSKTARPVIIPTVDLEDEKAEDDSQKNKDGKGKNKKDKTKKAEKKRDSKSVDDGDKKKKKLIPIIIGAVVVLLLAVILIPSGGKSKSKPSGSSVTSYTPSTAKPAPARETEAPTAAPDDGAGEELAWSEWDTELPEGIDGQNYLIETRQLYRATDALHITDGSEPEEGFVLYRSATGEFGEWSDWQKAAVAADENTEVEIQQGNSWSGWSGWTKVYSTANIPASTANRKVEYYQRNNEYHTSTWYEYRTSTMISGSAQYRFRTREVSDDYLREDGWSAYGEELIPQQEGRVVNVTTQYRFALREEGQEPVPSMENFRIENRDFTRHYADVDDNAWYGPGKNSILQTVDTLGILLPDEYLSFRPDDEISLGELIRAGVSIHQLYESGTGAVGGSNADEQRYITAAEQAGFIVKGEFPDMTKPATRQEMAYIFSKVLPQECLEPINEIEAISDMDMSRKYYDYALQLARAGVITVGEENTFRPEDGATRAEAAAMIEKLVHAESRTRQ